MGKATKIEVTQDRPNKVPLGDQIEGDKTATKEDRQKIRFRVEENEEFFDANLAKKILPQARRQQMELEEKDPSPSNSEKPSTKPGPDLSDDEDPPSEDEITGKEYYEVIEINEGNERALQMFMDRDRAPTRTLADIGTVQVEDLHPSVKAMWEVIRNMLVTYRSGKLPKAFKLIPSLPNWEQILYITDPPRWSAAAMYQATRIFVSNLEEKMAQRFFNLVLLPRIRDDIAEYKGLNFHLYQALRKALFMPGAFMKGILLPLLESGTCSLREAVIVGSVIGMNEIPILHSLAAILKIAEMEYTGANSIFLRIFFDKKYALPYRVIDGVFFHFLSFRGDNRELPVLWHQALLTFVQRYKRDISSEQKEALLDLLKKHNHHSITPEIRRELQLAECRDVEGTEPAPEPMAA